ncbi:MAG: putative molybdenum carrier protein [Luteolibacter sp.]
MFEATLGGDNCDHSTRVEPFQALTGSVKRGPIYRRSRFHSFTGELHLRELIKRIVSGGQTGADRAGLDAAVAFGIPHGGWCLKGRTAEDGTIPERYHLTETEGASYLARTERNVKQSDVTIVFTIGSLAGGSSRTVDFARRHRKPWLHLRLGQMDADQAADLVGQFVRNEAIGVLNVAGSSESREPEIYHRAVGVLRLWLALAGIVIYSIGLKNPAQRKLETQGVALGVVVCLISIFWPLAT